MNKTQLVTAGKFAAGVLATLIVVKLVKTYVAPKLPAAAQKVVGFITP